jgi:starch synthase
MKLWAALLLAAAPCWAVETRIAGPIVEVPVLAHQAIPSGGLPSTTIPVLSTLPALSLPAGTLSATATAPAAAVAKTPTTPYFGTGTSASTAKISTKSDRSENGDKSAAPAATALGAAQALSNASGTNGDGTTRAAASPEAGAATLGLFDGARPLRIVQAAGESVPFIKTGGLADVVDAVSRGLAARGHDVTLILGKYGVLKTGDVKFERLATPVPVRLDNRVEQAYLWVGKYEGVRVVLLENDAYFGRDGPYGSSYGDYGDNDERFVFYSQAVLAAAAALNLRPDIIHAHDWQAALIPPILKLQDANPALAAAKTVLTLHNMAFQGLFPAWSALKAGFSSRDFSYNKLEYHGKFSFLKSGVQYADALTTVSPNYAKQIKSHNDFGMGLEELLSFRAKDLHGILNGVDPKLWDPAADPILYRNYGVDDAAAGKTANKEALQRHAGLPVDGRKPMLGVAARFSHQKGIDMIAELIPELVRMGFQIAITGTGDADSVAWLQRLQAEFPENVWVNAAFSEEFARRIYAASDFLLMPSRFEPCGLSQLMAQRYGSLPIVTATGGLVDTVKDVRAHADGDGLFMGDISTQGLAEAAAAALIHYNDAGALARSRRAAMTKDSSWDKAILEYEALYRRITGV